VKLRPYTIHDADIVEKLRKHCEEGWSPEIFATKLQGTRKTFYFLYANNDEFRKVCLEFRRMRYKANGEAYLVNGAAGRRHEERKREREESRLNPKKLPIGERNK
jgi:hypothetical protein